MSDKIFSLMNNYNDAVLLFTECYKKKNPQIFFRFQMSLPANYQAFPFFIEAHDATLFKKIIDILVVQVNEVNFEINDAGIRIIGMESAQIALIDMCLTPTNFATYRITRPSAVGEGR
jgi:DNA polymerase III sliding clamp (beta) subunit (PCNA family)